MKHNLNGNRYEIVYTDNIPDDELGLLAGLCDAPTVKDKKIYIKQSLGIPMLIDTLIHEGLHSCLWCLAEDTVEQVATDLSKMLIKELGIEKAPASSHED
jgi:hypothetical protein